MGEAEVSIYAQGLPSFASDHINYSSQPFAFAAAAASAQRALSLDVYASSSAGDPGAGSIPLDRKS
jgi:hypothetical protein